MPAHFQKDLREQSEEGEQDFQSFIRSTDPEELFKLWLEWNGIIGYSSSIWEIVSGLQAKGAK
jgi:hypothetical protein